MFPWPWYSQHEEAILATDENDSEEDQQICAGRWDAYWGYDIVHNKGLLEAVLARLHVKQSSWQGLKKAPEVTRLPQFSPSLHLPPTIPFLAIISSA